MGSQSRPRKGFKIRIPKQANDKVVYMGSQTRPRIRFKNRISN